VRYSATSGPETNYEGELNELGTVVTITLPDAITADSRWRNFADTGLVEVGRGRISIARLINESY